MSLTMRKGETLKTYSERYWEMFNEIDGDFNDEAIRTFKVGLPTEHSLRKSLIGKLALVYANSWTKLISIKGSRKTSNRGIGRLRLSLKRGGILLGKQGLPMPRQLIYYFENQCTKF